MPKRGYAVRVKGYTYTRRGKRIHVPGYRRAKPNPKRRRK